MHIITELHTYSPVPSLLVLEWKWCIRYLLAVSSDLVACPNCTEWLHSCKVWLSGGEKETMYIHDYKPHCTRSTGAGGHKGDPSHEPIIITACVHRCFSIMRQAQCWRLPLLVPLRPGCTTSLTLLHYLPYMYFLHPHVLIQQLNLWLLKICTEGKKATSRKKLHQVTTPVLTTVYMHSITIEQST